MPEAKIENHPSALKAKIANYGSLVRFSHTVFVLPFAMASMPKHCPDTR